MSSRDATFRCDSQDCKIFLKMFAYLTWTIQMSAINVITNSVITLYCLSHISHEILKFSTYSVKMIMTTFR